MEQMMKSIHIEGNVVELQEEFPVRFACMEHFDQELDEYVNDYEVAPDTYVAQVIEDETVDKRCRACGEPGQIALLREKGL